MKMTGYVQPIAAHRDFPERLLLRDGSGRCFVWFGDGRDVEEIGEATAAWMLDCPEVCALRSPLFWFDLSSLPLAVALG